MTPDDVQYLSSLLKRGLIFSPCLELGVGLEGTANRELVTFHGITWKGSDFTAGESVDYQVDFESDLALIRTAIPDVKEFGSILVFNVLEHSFEPIKILDNVMALLRKGGTCAVVTPAIWPIHNFPIDCWRILPDFYSEYAKRRGYSLRQDCFEFIAKGSVPQHASAPGKLSFPPPARSSPFRLYSRVVHKLFNTYGRGMFFPSHVAIGAVFEK